MSDSPPSEILQIISPEPAWHLLDRYFGSQCTAAEAESVARWMAADPSNASLLERLRLVWIEASVVRPAIDDDAAWHALRDRIADALIETGRERVHRPLGGLPASSSRRRLWWGMAAAGLTAVVGAGIWWRSGTDAAAHATEPVAEFVTRRGQRPAEVMLLDGTRVWLGADSRLRVLRGTGAREVELEGQAYFIVRHEATRPFLVYSRGAVTEDLGTEFSVRAYADDEVPTTVVVSSGQVALRPEGAERGSRDDVKLTRGQMGQLHETGRVELVHDVDLASVLSWREGRLEFDAQPFADVARELARWYDLRISFDDNALGRVPVTASLGENQTADQALAIVAAALNVHYIRDDRQVQFSTRAS